MHVVSHSSSLNPVPGSPLSKMSALDKLDIISTIGSIILFIVTLSLTINYAVNPISPMIPITPHFSISLPLLVCSTIGTAMAMVLIIQMIRHSTLKIAFERCIGECITCSDITHNLLRFSLHPGGRGKGETVEDYQTKHKELIEHIEQFIGPSVNFQTRDGMMLGGYWYLAHKNAPTIIIFHGNGGTAEYAAGDWGSYYKSLGMNVLLAEYRGYGRSEGETGGSNQEMEAYFDAEAALKFVLDEGSIKGNIIAHGTSLGGAYATALAYFYGIKYVVLDHAFTSFAATMHHVSPLSMDLAQHAVYAAYDHLEAPKHATIPSAKKLRTDGFNTLRKIAQCRPKIFVIQGENDHLMPIQFGYQLVQAAYPNDVEKQRDCLCRVTGGHQIDNFFEDSLAQNQLLDFLAPHDVGDKFEFFFEALKNLG